MVNVVRAAYLFGAAYLILYLSPPGILFVYKRCCARWGNLSSVVGSEKRRCQLQAQSARHVCSLSGQSAARQPPPACTFVDYRDLVGAPALPGVLARHIRRGTHPRSATRTI